MSAARYHRRTDDDTAIFSIDKSTICNMIVNAILLLVVVPTYSRYYPLLI